MIVTTKNPLHEEFMNQISHYCTLGCKLLDVSKNCASFTGLKIIADFPDRYTKNGDCLRVYLTEPSNSAPYVIKAIWCIVPKAHYSNRPAVYAETLKEAAEVNAKRELRKELKKNGINIYTSSYKQARRQIYAWRKSKDYGKKLYEYLRYIDHKSPKPIEVSYKTKERFAEIIRAHKLSGLKTFNASQIVSLKRSNDYGRLVYRCVYTNKAGIEKRFCMRSCKSKYDEKFEFSR